MRTTSQTPIVKSNDTRVGQNLTIAALGVVYGDIGTSPLYAIKQCFHSEALVTVPRVLGVLSLIVWALIIVVTIKYIIVLVNFRHVPRAPY